jgi:glycogen debranching enzyme
MLMVSYGDKGARDRGANGPKGSTSSIPRSLVRSVATLDSAVIHVPGGQCRNAEVAARLEWLVTNGIGGFAGGTVAGCLTRRYHGLLIAALRPPLGRTLLLAKLDETARVGGEVFRLYSNWWAGGIEQPAGCRLLRRFDVALGVPTWTFEFAGCRLIKRVWMEQGHSTTYVQYELARSRRPIELCCRALVNHRDYHALIREDRRFDVAAVDHGLGVRAGNGGDLYLRCRGGGWRADHTWYRDFELVIERERGFDYIDNHLCAGACTITLAPGDAFSIVASTEPDADLDGSAALKRRERLARDLLGDWRRASPTLAEKAPPPVRQLILAADQFVVERSSRSQEIERPRDQEIEHAGQGAGATAPGKTIIAGYPWFTDWGRDTMISLPGLTLVTGRGDVAREILLTYARCVDHGMIPNRYPDEGETPDYNSVDATLWSFWAASHYVHATGDVGILDTLFPVLADIVEWFRRGTRHNIHIADDGLVYAGAPGVQLTWMDAKIDDYVVTPRIGKPVELSALWYDALLGMADFAAIMGKSPADYRTAARQTRVGFAKFWNDERSCCYDVIDGPDGHEAALRPNQIFAVSISADRAVRGNGRGTAGKSAPVLLPPAKQRAVVDACERHLAAWFGLRTLAPDDLGYRGRYGGDYRERDSAYHQGTAWGWLLGPYVLAHHAVHGDAAAAKAMLEPMFGQLWQYGVGSLSEIFDGDEPNRPDGCIAQAWSVAETLRAWHVLSGQ